MHVVWYFRLIVSSSCSLHVSLFYHMVKIKEGHKADVQETQMFREVLSQSKLQIETIPDQHRVSLGNCWPVVFWVILSRSFQDFLFEVWFMVWCMQINSILKALIWHILCICAIVWLIFGSWFGEKTTLIAIQVFLQAFTFGHEGHCECCYFNRLTKSIILSKLYIIGICISCNKDLMTTFRWI